MVKPHLFTEVAGGDTGCDSEMGFAGSDISVKNKVFLFADEGRIYDIIGGNAFGHLKNDKRSVQLCKKERVAKPSF